MRDRPPSSWRRVDGVGLIIRLWAGSAATFDLCTGRDEHQGAGASHREERLPAPARRAAVDGRVGLLAGHFFWYSSKSLATDLDGFGRALLESCASRSFQVVREGWIGLYASSSRKRRHGVQIDARAARAAAKACSKSARARASVSHPLVNSDASPHAGWTGYGGSHSGGTPSTRLTGRRRTSSMVVKTRAVGR